MLRTKEYYITRIAKLESKNGIANKKIIAKAKRQLKKIK